MVMITLYARQQKRHRCIEQSFDSVEEGEGGMIWENGIETCIISYMKQIASPGSMHDTASVFYGSESEMKDTHLRCWLITWEGLSKWLCSCFYCSQ